VYKDGGWRTPADRQFNELTVAVEPQTILYIIVAVGGIVTVNNIINLIRRYLIQGGIETDIEGEYSGFKLKLTFRDLPSAGYYASQQLVELRDSPYLRKAIIGATIESLYKNGNTWSDMNVTVP
jgi:hypothetical protein